MKRDGELRTSTGASRYARARVGALRSGWRRAILGASGTVLVAASGGAAPESATTVIAQTPQQQTPTNPTDWCRLVGVTSFQTVAGKLEIRQASPTDQVCEIRLAGRLIARADEQSQRSGRPLGDYPTVLASFGPMAPFDEVLLLGRNMMGNLCGGSGVSFLGLKKGGSHAFAYVPACAGPDAVVTRTGDKVTVTLPESHPNRGYGSIPGQTWVYRHGAVQRVRYVTLPWTPKSDWWKPDPYSPPALARTPNPALWPSTWKKKLDLIRAVCPPSYSDHMANGLGPTVGCETDSPGVVGVSYPNEPPTGVDETTISLSQKVGMVFEGAFSKPNAIEAAVVVRSDREDGVLLLESIRGSWHFKGFVPDVASCQRLRRKSGRDAVVCAASSGQDERFEYGVGILDWDTAAHWRPLVSLPMEASLPQTICKAPAAVPILSGKPSTPQFVDLDRDGADDIRIDVNYSELSADALAELRSAPQSDPVCGCELEEEAREGFGAVVTCPALALPSPVVTTLTFFSRGDELVASDATRRFLEHVSEVREKRLAPQ